MGFADFKSRQKPQENIWFPFFAVSPLSYWFISESSSYIGRYWSFWRHLFNNSTGGDKKWWKHVICRGKWRNCRFIGRHFPSNEWQQHLEQSSPCFSPVTVVQSFSLSKCFYKIVTNCFQSFPLDGMSIVWTNQMLARKIVNKNDPLLRACAVFCRHPTIHLYLVDIMFQCMVGLINHISLCALQPLQKLM